MFRFLSLSALLLSSTFVQAHPAISRRAVAPGLLTQLEYVAQYAAAAYCPANNVPNSPAEVVCNAGNCPLVEAAQATTLVEFQNVGPADGTGFVGVDHSKQLIVIAFRGSQSVGNWLANFNIAQKPYAPCSGCTVHSGFYDTWRLVSATVLPIVAAAVQQFPSYRVITTGHSLGAAVATIAAGDLRNAGYTVGLYSYGSPMTGNSAFADYISGRGENYRVTSDKDLVPKLPGYLLGYAHISSEYWITAPSGSPVTPADIQVSSGPLNIRGNQGTLESNVDDHGVYFGRIAACGPGFEFVRA